MSPDDSFDEQLTKYLTDAHSIEKQALTQMKAAPKIAGDHEIEAAFVGHLTETEGHEQLVRQRLKARDASPRRSRTRPGRSRARGLPSSPSSTPIHRGSSSTTPTPTSTWSSRHTTC